jgi:hypothetical protein
MRDGKITESGNRAEILESGEELKKLFKSHDDALSMHPSGNLGSSYHPGGNGNTLFIAEDKKDGNNDEGIVQNGQLVQEEEREKGRVGFIVYWEYVMMAYSGALVPLILLSHIIFQVLQIGSNFWMAWAAPISEDVNPPVSSLLMVNVYFVLAIVSSLCIFMRSYLLVKAGCKTATIIFEKNAQLCIPSSNSFL